MAYVRVARSVLVVAALVQGCANPHASNGDPAFVAPDVFTNDHAAFIAENHPANVNARINFGKQIARRPFSGHGTYKEIRELAIAGHTYRYAVVRVGGIGNVFGAVDVTCEFADEYPASVRALKPGQTVAIKGEIATADNNKTFGLKQCSVSTRAG